MFQNLFTNNLVNSFLNLLVLILHLFLFKLDGQDLNMSKYFTISKDFNLSKDFNITNDFNFNFNKDFNLDITEDYK